ncbi:hypothetical protein C1Y35_19700 [Pseudomonas sp. GW456-L14]|uniref:hypothetical protein n=1 Tax=unclassified Pseudomonas TaxID=196821 RepID=UPI000C8863F0|nr:MULTISPECIES: hypothetical protein [unclassified Pseudomonas]PMY37313.1 hypothetical protein C1Y35_19700 [Pseudomonas sp. GW456-L14]PMY59370.1 hypothetical protein C1Y34_02270 [Pseudomonas sp. GW456-L12]
MKQEFKKLRQTLLDPADGPHALVKMREQVIDALQNWPKERYPITDLLLPHGKPVSQESRRVLGYLINILEKHPVSSAEIFDLASGLRLISW